MTSLLPTRWILILSAKLIHLQVDAEVHLARDGERDEEPEEAETEVLEYPLRTVLMLKIKNHRHAFSYFIASLDTMSLLALYQQSPFQV